MEYITGSSAATHMQQCKERPRGFIVCSRYAAGSPVEVLMSKGTMERDHDQAFDSMCAAGLYAARFGAECCIEQPRVAARPFNRSKVKGVLSFTMVLSRRPSVPRVVGPCAKPSCWLSLTRAPH